MRHLRFGLVSGAVFTLVFGGVAWAQESTDWSGFYAGIFAGYAVDRDEATTFSIPTVTVESDPGETQTFGLDSSRSRIETPFGGINAGYDHQFGRFVLGAEGAVALGGFSKSAVGNQTINITDNGDYSNNSISTNKTFSLDWLTTLSVKAGMDLNGWLAYGKAGIAVADISSASNTTYTVDSNVGVGVLGPIANGTYNFSDSSSMLHTGFVIGAGIEKMVTENISLGVEYNYVHLGEFEVASSGIFSENTEIFGANVHAVAAKLNYHF